jgi:hypothetical protein
MPRRPAIVRLVVAVACLLATAPVAMASLVQALGLAELTWEADRVVVGDVLSVRAAWDSEHRNIHTTIEIGVHEIWKGAPPTGGRVTIRQLGGTVGEIEMTVLGMPTFAEGERALLFLKRSQVAGMAQGKRNLRWESSGKRWLADAANHAQTVTIDSRGKLQAVGPGRPEPLDILREQVRNLVGK